MTSPESVVLRNLELEQFRVYESLSLEVPDAGLRIIGANGTGKSSLLEAIELISTTRPRRGALDSDLIAHGSGVDLGVPPYARVDASVWRSDALVQIGVFIQRYEHRSGTKKVLKVADRS
ncbi:MAG: AAA family ATPase, partial [Thermomicrobiales bacterium]|nr:AAA family ATPase [Thermomicrobiales bacterium]